MRGGVVTSAKFRYLNYGGNYRLNESEELYKTIVNQYKEALDYIVGKNLDEHLNALYSPGKIVSSEIDGHTSATIRSNKIISAIRDGLNRGVYSY